MTTTERTWIVNGKTVTLAQFKAEIAARSAMAKPIMDAFRSNDLDAVAKAQSAMRAVYK
jgi:hypothetical protein